MLTAVLQQLYQETLGCPAQPQWGNYTKFIPCFLFPMQPAKGHPLMLCLLLTAAGAIAAQNRYDSDFSRNKHFLCGRRGRWKYNSESKNLFISTSV